MFLIIFISVICGAILTYVLLFASRYFLPKSIHPLYIIEKRKSKKRENSCNLVCELLTSMNCTYKTKINDEEITSIDFNYQSGSFSIDTSSKSSYIKIYYLFIYETESNKLALVRHLCNHLNINSKIPKFIYSIDEVQNKIYVHIYSCALFTAEINNIKSYLENLLIGNFEYQRIFSLQFKELETECGTDTDDLEESNANWKRQLFLLREQEIQHQNPKKDCRFNETRVLTIGQLIKTLCGQRGLIPMKLSILTATDHYTIEEADRICEFDILSAIVEKDNNMPPQIKSELVTLVASCDFINSNGKVSKRILTATLTPEGSSEDSLYFRLTTSLSATNINKAIGQNKPNNSVAAQSMLIAYDYASPKQKIDEFCYMNSDAIWKIKNKKANELSPEQQLLAMCSSSNPSYNLYWGKKLYLEKRYYEALLHLENGYYEMQYHYTKMSKHQKNVFYELCFLIGFCYCELGEYQRAYYFLDALPQLNNIVYTQEYINCLANSKDFRALNVIDNLLNFVVKDEDGDGEEVNSSLVSFINFLRRRKAYVYIDIGELEEAERIYTEMLEEPENSDYALNELAYIQRLKKESEKSV